MKKSIQIAIAADSNYFVQVIVVLKSLFVNNSNEKFNINFLCIPSLIKPEDLIKIEEFVILHGNTFSKLEVKDEYLNIFPETRHSKNTFLRLLLPILIPNLNKILYLDSDIVVHGGIRELYDTDINNFYLAAVKEVTHIYNKQYLIDLNIGEKYFYFGAGIILLNLKKMREDEIFIRFENFINKNINKLKGEDQDVLNAILWNNVKYLPPKYNFNFYIEKDVASQVWSNEELEEVYKNPAIIHYIGPIKPWNYLSFHPKTSLWWHYLKLTPYKNYKAKNRSFCNFFKKLYIVPYRKLERSLTLSQKQKFGKLIPLNIKLSFKRIMLKK